MSEFLRPVNRVGLNRAPWITMIMRRRRRRGEGEEEKRERNEEEENLIVLNI